MKDKILNPIKTALSFIWVVSPIFLGIAIAIGVVWIVFSLAVFTLSEHAEFIWRSVHLTATSLILLVAWLIIASRTQQKETPPAIKRKPPKDIKI